MSRGKYAKKRRELRIDNLNEEIFKYLKPNSDNKLSTFNATDLLDLLYYLDNFYLILRKKLGFDNSITFGLEIECEHASKEKIKNEINNEWKVKYDGSLSNGVEINSPILKDRISTWQNLKKVCEITKEHAKIGLNSGGHIHIGKQILGTKYESWLHFFKLWSTYENVIYRFCYGDFLTYRESMLNYANPISNVLWKEYLNNKNGDKNYKEILKNVIDSRYQAVNFQNIDNIKNTIEFRCPNSTFEPVIWQNNVNLLVNILKYSKCSEFDDDLIQRRHRINEKNYNKLNFYNEIYLQQALELSDMIFNNNLDKIYFLRQYLKSFTISDKILEKSKEFIKNK